MDFRILSVAAITIIAYLMVQTNRVKDEWIPLICGAATGVNKTVKQLSKNKED